MADRIMSMRQQLFDALQEGEEREEGRGGVLLHSVRRSLLL